MGCTLCPRLCGADRENGERGYCGVGSTVRVARAAPHFWEEPCLCGPGGSGTVFFSGCNLGCVYCQNAPLSIDTVGYDLKDGALASLFLSLQEKGVSNLNLVTPTPWVPKIREALDAAWSQGFYLPVVFNCGGYERVETLASLAGYVSVYLTDFKYLSSSKAAAYSRAPDYPTVALDALREMVRQRGEPRFTSEGLLKSGVIVRHLMLPDMLDDTLSLLSLLASEFGDSILVSLMSQYTPMPAVPPPLDRRVSEADYRIAADNLRRLGLVGFLQEGEASEASFIPLFNGEGIDPAWCL